MSAHIPPVPPDNRSDKAPSQPREKDKARDTQPRPQKDSNQDAVKQNTENPGYQQDR
jgi:hypothetical protein